VIDEQDKREDAEETVPEADVEATPETVDPDTPAAEEPTAEEAPTAEEPTAEVEADAETPSAEKPEADADAEAEPGMETPAEDAPKPRRRRRARKAPEAEGTAAAETGVDKDAAATAKVEEAEAEAKPATSRSRDGEPAVAVRALAKYVRTSPRKARLVADHVRGKSVDEARAILAFSPRSVARDWSKVLESAVANAEHNHELVGDELRIKAITADEGPTLKRYRPRAMGRATRIRKRTSHLTITLTPKDAPTRPDAKGRKRTAGRAGSRRNS
jgi:large subunit ribosomal protein L22